MNRLSAPLAFGAGLALFFLINQSAVAHGGVVLEEDRCVINIGFLTAHFTVYQPETRANEEFCEDIPDVTSSVFVMEYLHDFLREMPVDFRVIRDVNDVGEFARWEDVQAIDDLEAVTVYYKPPTVETNGNYTAEYAFAEKGTYIGVVTAQHPDGEREYNAVFFFQVGGPDLGTIPLFLGLLVILQLGYWWSNGGWAKLRDKTAGPEPS
ncbi:MAG: hypothetical protein KJN90_07725 [Gammaproteobacteria bacterium]|nr:hypothetical protein [Gammaproteobacteria bacterium]